MLKELNEGGANALAAAEKEMEQTASVYLAVPVWENGNRTRSAGPVSHTLSLGSTASRTDAREIHIWGCMPINCILRRSRHPRLSCRISLRSSKAASVLAKTISS